MSDILLPLEPSQIVTKPAWYLPPDERAGENWYISAAKISPEDRAMLDELGIPSAAPTPEELRDGVYRFHDNFFVLFLAYQRENKGEDPGYGKGRLRSAKQGPWKEFVEENQQLLADMKAPLDEYVSNYLEAGKLTSRAIEAAKLKDDELTKKLIAEEEKLKPKVLGALKALNPLLFQAACALVDAGFTSEQIPEL